MILPPSYFFSTGCIYLSGGHVLSRRTSAHKHPDGPSAKHRFEHLKVSQMLVSSQITHLDVPRHIVWSFQNMGEHLAVPLDGDDLCPEKKEVAHAKKGQEDEWLNSATEREWPHFRRNDNTQELNGCKCWNRKRH